MFKLLGQSIQAGPCAGNSANGWGETMRKRTRKLIGTTFLVVFVPVYAMFIVVIAAPYLPGTTILAQTLFFLVTGLIWVLPAGAVINWMLRPDDRPSG